MEASNSRIFKYLNANLNSNTAFYYAEITKKVKNKETWATTESKMVMLKDAAFQEISTVQGTDYEMLAKEHQVVILSQLIKKLRGGDLDENALSPKQLEMKKIGDQIEAYAEEKIKMMDRGNVDCEKAKLADEVERYLNSFYVPAIQEAPHETKPVDDPVQQYLGVSTSKENPALSFKAGKVVSTVFSDQEVEGNTLGRQNQLLMQMHIISVLKGDLPMIDPKKWPPDQQPVIQTAQDIARTAIEKIKSQPHMDAKRAEAEQAKLAAKIESDMLANFATHRNILTARKTLFESSPPEIIAKKVTLIAEKYISVHPVEKAAIAQMAPGTVKKLSRKLVKDEHLPKSVYIFTDFQANLHMSVHYHRTITGVKRAPSSEYDQTRLGQGAFSLAKRSIDASGQFHVPKKTITEDSTAIVDSYNEQNAVAKYRSLNPRNILLPEALGTLKPGEHAQEGALKEVKGFMYPFAEGGALSTYLAGAGPFVPKRTLEQNKALIYDVINGVREVHIRNLAHRDLKPDNILIHQGIAKIADHGNALDPSNDDHNKRLPGNLNPLSNAVPNAGTLPFIAPEAVGNPKHRDELDREFARASSIEKAFLSVHNNQMADIWSLGLILFQLMNTPNTDSKPFEGGPMLIQKKSDEKLHELAKYTVLREYDSNSKEYQMDFEKFRENCKGRFTEKQCEAVISCLSVDPSERPEAAALLKFFEKT